MDSLIPWLLILLAGLAIACQVFYVRMRRAESVRSAMESLQNEERRNVEATLTALVSDEVETPADWRPQALVLSRCGLSPSAIAKRLGVSAGEVELVLSLAQTAESTKRGKL